MTATTGGALDVSVIEPGHMEPLARFASQRPLAYNDFASLALLQPPEPRVWGATAGGEVVAAAIDDGLAMSVGGTEAGLAALAATIPDVAGKLVVAGREPEVAAFIGPELGATRRARAEHFMCVTRAELRMTPEDVPLRVAEEPDLPMLIGARARALEEEYGIPVPPDGHLYGELASAVKRAVAVRGVAIWVEDDHVAFTAQLIAKTDAAAMFGDLYTDPELRGAGRATRALTAFCGWLMSESQCVTLRVGTENMPAVRLYERTGFRVIDSFVSSLRDRPGDQPGS
jgi:GNAT superfamily N-acetyltransferase